MRKIYFFISLFIAFFITARAETFLLKNGSMITGKLMSYSSTREVYVVNVYGKHNLIEKIYDLKKKDVEAVLVKQVVNGIDKNTYKNFKYGFSIEKPSDKWFFIENKFSLKPLITIAKTMSVKDYTPRFRLFIFDKVREINDKIFESDYTFSKFAKNFFIKNFKTYLGYEEGVESFNGIRFYWRIANNFVFDDNGSEVKMKYKQYLTVRNDTVYIMDYCEDEKKFSRETDEFKKVVKTFKFLREKNIYYQIAKIYIFKKKYEIAKKYLKLAIKFEPTRGELYQVLGDVYGRLGMTDEALSYFKEALKLGADEAITKFNIKNTGEDFYNGIE